MKLLPRTVFALAFVALSVASSGAQVTTLKLVQPVLTDDKEGTMKQPEGVACGDAALFVVADTGNGRLLTYTFRDGVVKGGGEIRLSQLPYPGRLQMNSKGEILALDGKLRRIARLSQQGAFLAYLDPEGLPSAAPVVPRSFKVGPRDNVYLLDIYSERVLVLDPAGKYQREVKFPATQGERSFSDLAVKANGDLLLVDSVNSVVYAAASGATSFTPLTKSLKEDMDFPTYITLDDRGGIYLVDQNGGGIVLLGPDGSFRGRMLSMGWKPGFLSYPSQICLDGKGTLLIADRDNNRVQLFEIMR